MLRWMGILCQAALASDLAKQRLTEVAYRAEHPLTQSHFLDFTRARWRRTTDVLVRRSPTCSTRTDEDVRPTKCLISRRVK